MVYGLRDELEVRVAASRCDCRTESAAAVTSAVPLELAPNQVAMYAPPRRTPIKASEAAVKRALLANQQQRQGQQQQRLLPATSSASEAVAAAPALVGFGGPGSSYAGRAAAAAAASEALADSKKEAAAAAKAVALVGLVAALRMQAQAAQAFASSPGPQRTADSSELA
ncbi:hypothetical protein CHLRE_01g055461v5 [Chlamydomonas reinhardtii]|uniref:Uncharacterized protein n=1 Tax=Chlamydomonas reinhardtii TaxID=3055 RepID=A0A2K3E8D6_CHLRE|nr:uncharacterized protein CHLRE_01g055461v5 [Chlamydomonas reinhardtii]PNW89045.1 hypothetical protein CHLRE_01g055461v5 [Chlamydomonas reinhardtii]